ncbi:MAG: tetratricopeptide repeat protein [Bacteroidota bacterium]
MIKSLHKSFIPYIILLMLIIIGVFIFDSYAERISREPELIYLGQEDHDADTHYFSGQMGNEIALKNELDRGGDTVYMAAMELFRNEQYQMAEEKVIYLLNRSPRSPDAWNLRGLIAVRQLEHHEAELHLLQALKEDQRYNEARINLASLYMNMHRYREAENQYKQAKQEDPNNPGICYNLGLLYTETGQFSASMKEFRTSADLASGNRKSRALCQLGMVQLGVNDTVTARENLEEAILLNPRNELARLHLALTYNQHAEREKELMKIYSLNPSSFQANYYLARLYMEKELLSRAEFHYKKALEKQPYHEHLLNQLGDLLISQNRLEEAELVLSGFATGDTLPQAYFFQAKIASGRGSTEEAIRLYRLAVSESFNEYPEAYLNMAILYRQQDNPVMAIESYRSAIAARPYYSLAYYNLGVLYTELDSSDRAIESYLESIRIDSSALKSWYNLGRLYDNLGSTASAIDAYEKALEIQPDYTKALLTLANAFLRSDNFPDATKHYLRLLSIHPNYSKAWFNLGLTYNRQDQPGKAMEAYEKLIEVNPDNVKARINLAILYGRNDQVELAISVLEDAMDLDTDNPDIRFNLGLQQKKLNQLNKAVYQFLQVIELDPGYRRAYDQLLILFNELDDDVNYEIVAFRKNREFGIETNFYQSGKRLHELGQYQMALEAYQLARTGGDDRDWLLYWTGKAYLDLEETEEAVGWFHSVLERDPEHKFSHYRLGQAYEMLGDPVRAETFYTALLQLDQDFKIIHKSPTQQ